MTLRPTKLVFLTPDSETTPKFLTLKVEVKSSLGTLIQRRFELHCVVHSVWRGVVALQIQAYQDVLL